MSRREAIRGLGGVISLILIAPRAWSEHCRLYDCPLVDIPVSLAATTIRTPEFSVQHKPYLILVQAQWQLPIADMMCMMGVTTGPLSEWNCNRAPILQAEWTVFDEGRVIAHGGIVGPNGQYESSHDALSRYLGSFIGISGRKFVLEVKFIRDGTALDVTHPRLIVKHDPND